MDDYDSAYKLPPRQTLLEIKFGSHLYGTSTPESDLDVKGIYLPRARDIVLQSYNKTIQIGRNKAECERNTKDDVDKEYFSLDRYLELLCDGQTVALDMLFSPDSMVTFDHHWIWVWRAIKLNKDKLLSKNINAFVGYARQQAAKYGIKGSRMDAVKRTMELLEQLPEYDRLSKYAMRLGALVLDSDALISLEKSQLISIELIEQVDGGFLPHLQVCGRKMPLSSTVLAAKKCYGRVLDAYGARAQKAHLAGGVDWKALSHAVRVNSEALELLQTGHVTFPCPNKDLQVKIKTGQLPYDEVAHMIEQGLADLTEAQKISPLRDTPDREWAKNLVAEVYTKIVKES